MLYPVIWMVDSSFKDQTTIFSSPGLTLKSPEIANYREGWTGLGTSFQTFILNSVAISAAAVIGTVLSCSLTAYAFARLEFRFRKVLFAIMLSTIMLPFQVVLVPQYLIFHYLGWVNTILPLVVPHFFGGGAFFIFLTVQFIRGIPRELDDAASVDGADPFKIYWYILLPLMRPALVTTAIFTFIWTWNDFLGQLIYLNEPSKYTVAVALQAFLDQQGESEWGSMLAMSTISLIPLLLIFAFFQRRLVEGISTTGMGGS